ncbi:unnamed protein product [Mycena citricolor]|uniref:Uncharacterized protein n=1 Tax=Mycena citricolor TaxID=2018698 RepID=A0AAD2HBY1_9AGAR|nr:unnamed protein product [Mycena citricolor]
MTLLYVSASASPSFPFLSVIYSGISPKKAETLCLVVEMLAGCLMCFRCNTNAWITVPVLSSPRFTRVQYHVFQVFNCPCASSACA